MELLNELLADADPTIMGQFGLAAMIVVEVVRGIFARFGFNFRGLPLTLLVGFSLFFAYLVVPRHLPWEQQLAGIILLGVGIAAPATGLRSWGKSIALKATENKDEPSLADLQKQFDDLKKI